MTFFSLVGTTAVGFNLFLGGTMAKGRNLASAQRGIAFSCFAAFLVSELILMVGAGSFLKDQEQERSPEGFTIQQLTGFVEEFTGSVGVFIFAIGFIAAALSSQLATPLGATATAESIFFMESTTEVTENPYIKGDVEVQRTETSASENQEEKRDRSRMILVQSTNFVMVAIAATVIVTNGNL